MATPLESYINMIKTQMKNNPIPEIYKIVLKHLRVAEGGTLHYNTGETDITNSYGIYRTANPKAEVFTYIDLIAKKTVPSSKWTKLDTIAINKLIDPVIEEYLSYLFYKEYFKGAQLELFHKDNVILMVNLYTNTTKGAWMSIQEGLIDMQKFGYLKIPFSELSVVDGSFGNKTKNNLLLLKEMNTDIQRIFKLAVINGMKTYYIKLAAENPTKFLQYLKGWDNRMEYLQHQ